MTWRSVLLGILLGVVIAGGTYLNDWIVAPSGTRLTGQLMPTAVFGVVVLLALLGPVAGWMLHRKMALRPVEIAIIAALGLAVCSWPGASFFRYYATMMVMPATHYRNRVNWQAVNILSYVPDGSALLAEGYVRDWVGFCQLLDENSIQPTGGTPAALTAHRIWTQLDPAARKIVKGAVEKKRISPQNRRKLTDALNAAVLMSPQFVQKGMLADLPWSGAAEQWRGEWESGKMAGDSQSHQLQQWNRAVLVAALPGHIMPPPAGEGVMMNGGRSDPEMDAMPAGNSSGKKIWPQDIPWEKWLPSLMLWGGFMILIGLACLCMMLVVHPQWANRELLPYPIARFVEDLTARKEGELFPEAMHSRLFWIGFGLLMVIHLINGLRAWFPEAMFLQIPMSFSFHSLRTGLPIFSNLKDEGAGHMFTPRFYLSAIAFAFFLTTEVSFSVAFSLPLWSIFCAMLISYGVTLQTRFTDYSQNNLILAGGCVGFSLMAIYAGRRYYWDVARGVVGLKPLLDTPASSIWAARGLVLLVMAATLWMSQLGGLDWMLALPMVLLILLEYLAAARVNAETGSFFVTPRWQAASILTVLLGMQVIGPTMYLILTLGSFLTQWDMREIASVMFANGLRIGERTGQTRAGRVGLLMGGMFLVGFVVALLATFTLQYNYGLLNRDSYAINSTSPYPLNRMTAQVNDLAASGELEASMQGSVMDRLGSIRPHREGLTYIGLGLALVIGCSWARMRFAWWPVHPAIFIFWGTWPSFTLGWSFFMGGLLKIGVVKLAGVKGYHMVRPLMIGVIAGELAMGMVWIIVGFGYYLVTGHPPTSGYSIFPV